MNATDLSTCATCGYTWTRGQNGSHSCSAELLSRVAHLEALINTPEVLDFIRGVQLESAHQRERWPSDHDAGKMPADWFWLIGYLGGKALHHATELKRLEAQPALNAQDNAEMERHRTKFLHHIITTAAACANWHLHAMGKTNMRPGIEEPAP